MTSLEKPFVSVCTPTFNRRPFFPAAIECFKQQDYPKDRMEWIIVDDGTDKIEDLIKDIPQVKYFKYDEQMVIGKKRNITNDKASGDIIVYMDDDDYYCPTRVSHAVRMLQMNPEVLCAGGSKQLIYFKHINKLYQFGPYHDRHGTAGTFAFRKELLDITRFDDNAGLAEEKSFLKNFSIPFIQLDYRQTSVMFSHTQNTYDKRDMIKNNNERFVKPSNLVIDDVVCNEKLKNFYLNEVDELLENYKIGETTMKPEVLRQIKLIEQARKNSANQQIQGAIPMFHFTGNNGERISYTPEQIIEVLKNKDRIIMSMKNELDNKVKEIQFLKTYYKIA